MKTYVQGLKVSEILEPPINTGGGSYDHKSNTQVYRFTVKMKDGHNETFRFYELLGGKEHQKVRDEIIDAYNEYNNIPEMYILMNRAYAKINGEVILFGEKVQDQRGKSYTLTLKEIDELRKQFKIKDPNSRQLAYIEMLTIENGKCEKPIPQRYIDQLKYMGYDISKLEYKLKES